MKSIVEKINESANQYSIDNPRENVTIELEDTPSRRAEKQLNKIANSKSLKALARALRFTDGVMYFAEWLIDTETGNEIDWDDLKKLSVQPTCKIHVIYKDTGSDWYTIKINDRYEMEFVDE